MERKVELVVEHSEEHLEQEVRRQRKEVGRGPTVTEVGRCGS